MMIFQEAPDLCESSEVRDLGARQRRQRNARAVVELAIGVENGEHAVRRERDRQAVYKQLEIVHPRGACSGEVKAKVESLRRDVPRYGNGIKLPVGGAAYPLPLQARKLDGIPFFVDLV